jgi:thiamine kinase-like enzyme
MELYQILISISIAFLMGYLISYFKEKGKNNALKSDIAKITNEKERVIIEYSKELEKIKKEYQLDIDKRKYKYESKQEQFKKFFLLLDQLTSESSQNLQKKITPIISEFHRNFKDGEMINNNEESNKAISKFSDDLHTLMSESNKYLIRLRAETNGLKLIANKEILETLDKLDKAYENVFNNSYEFIKLMAIPENFRDIDFLIKSMAKVDLDGKAVLDLRDLLLEQIRIELDKI